MAERILKGKIDVVVARSEHGQSALSPCGDGCDKEPATCREIMHDLQEGAALCDKFRQIIFVREEDK
jgi:hypothetical protein